MTIHLSTEYGSSHQVVGLRHYKGQRGEDKDKAVEISQGS
jgi:hypothetical protein